MAVILTRKPGASEILSTESAPHAPITLEKAQQLVGGLVDKVTVAQGRKGRAIDLLVNDEGKLLGLAPALALSTDDGKIQDLAVGDVAFVAATREGDWVGLSREEAEAVRGMFTGQFLLAFGGGGLVPILVPSAWKRAPEDPGDRSGANTLRFNDGVIIDTSGPLRLHREHDGWYVTGEGLLIPVSGPGEGDAMIRDLSHGRMDGGA